MPIKINNTYTYLQKCVIDGQPISKIQIGNKVVWNGYRHIAIMLPAITSDKLFSFKLNVYNDNKQLLYSECIESDSEIDIPYNGYVKFVDYNECKITSDGCCHIYPVFGQVFALTFKNLSDSAFIPTADIPDMFYLRDYLYNFNAFDIEPGRNNFPATLDGKSKYYYRFLYYVNNELRCIAAGDNYQDGVLCGSSISNCGNGRYTIKYGNTFRLYKLFICSEEDKFLEKAHGYLPGPVASLTSFNFSFHSITHDQNVTFDCYECRSLTDSWLTLGYVYDT